MALVRVVEGIIPEQMAQLATIASRGLTQVILGQADIRPGWYQAICWYWDKIMCKCARAMWRFGDVVTKWRFDMSIWWWMRKWLWSTHISSTTIISGIHYITSTITSGDGERERLCGKGGESSGSQRLCRTHGPHYPHPRHTDRCNMQEE